MTPEFVILSKSRGGEGVSRVVTGLLPVLVSFGFLAGTWVCEIRLPLLVYLLLAAVGIGGTVFLCVAVRDVVSAKQWEFRCSDSRVLWLSRDPTGEKIDCEIQIREIAELLYVVGHGKSAASMRVGFLDRTTASFPFVGSPDTKEMANFLSYWRKFHPEIPIRNVDPA